VPEDQLSLAIGKDGQNVRLAAKLTGWKIDVRSHETLDEEALAKEMAVAEAEEMSDAKTEIAPVVQEERNEGVEEEGKGEKREKKEKEKDDDKQKKAVKKSKKEPKTRVATGAKKVETATSKKKLKRMNNCPKGNSTS